MDFTDLGPAFVLRNARVPRTMAPSGLPVMSDGLVGCDIWLSGSRIEALSPRGRPSDGRRETNLAEAMVWALPVDCHTHIDKGQVWGRSPNPDGTFPEAIAAAAEDRVQYFSQDDLRLRAEFTLDCALAHGTAALRSHVDADRATFDAAFEVLADIALRYQERIDVQLAPFTGIGDDPDWIRHVARKAQHQASGVLSAFLYTHPDLECFLDQVFELAARFGMALDFHADENLDPESHCLRAIAKAALRTGFDGAILVGHACALSVQSPDEVAKTLDLVAQAGIGIVALPLCNSYLMDRGPISPRARGIAPVKEIAARGIPVALASDNVRDAFHAYGDMNLPELFRQAIPMMQLDHPVSDWPAAITTTAAQLMGRPDLGRLSAGGPANLMVFAARNYSEFGARPAVPTLLLRNGLPVVSDPPAFSRLDKLTGMTP